MLSIILFSCKKESSIVESNEDNQNSISILAKGGASYVNELEVMDWLEKQKDVYNNTPEIDSFIENVANNLNFEKILKEDYGDGEYIISIPVSGHLSMHDKDENTSTFLVVLEDDNGEIRRGELALLDDDNNSIDSLSMYDLYLNNPLSDDEYSVKLVSLQDYMFVDKTMSKEHLKDYNSYYGKVIDNENCTHYYWVHGTYDLNTGEILDYDVTDLGCLSCPPNAKCAVIQGGSGEGAGVEQPKPVEKKVTVLISSYPWNSYRVDFYATYILSGIRNAMPSLSKFSGISYENFNGVLFPNYAMLPSDPNYFIINGIRHNEIWEETYAIGNLFVFLNFPNQFPNIERAPQGTHKFFPENL